MKMQSTNQFLSNSTVKKNIFKDLREVMNKHKAFFTNTYIGDNLSDDMAAHTSAALYLNAMTIKAFYSILISQDMLVYSYFKTNLQRAISL